MVQRPHGPHGASANAYHTQPSIAEQNTPDERNPLPPPTQGKLADCKTVIWNGPMGVFEYEAFAKARPIVAYSLPFVFLLASCWKDGLNAKS